MTREYRRIPTAKQHGILDFSFLQDAPAGKHGFLSVDNAGHFEFEDGTRERFMGVNLAFSAALCTHEMADKIVPDLAQNGVNMVRFHHVDSAGDHSLLDTSAGNSQTLNEEMFDRLDYLVARLKEAGIYVHIDLHTLRTYFPNDGISAAEAEQLTQPSKSIHWYDKRIIDLQKKFISQYLGRLNPYTGLTYLEDPVVAIVQYVNENGIFWDTGTEYPSLFYDVLEARWNAWLLNRYEDRDGLRAAWTNAEGIEALHPQEDPSAGTVRMPELGIWGEARADWHAYYKGPDSPPRMADHKAFLIETQKQTQAEIHTYLRDLGCRCVINYSNLPNGVAELSCIAEGEVTEHNNYWNHPLGGFRLPLRFHDKAMVQADPSKLEGSFARHSIGHLASGAVRNKPFVITEWNACAQTAFRTDTLLQMAAYAAYQDWDGILLFTYSEDGSAELASERGMFGNFASAADPAIWAFYGLASYIFRRGLVVPATLKTDLVFTPEDVLLNPSDYGLLVQQLSFMSGVRAVFPSDGVYQGEADLAISSGHTPNGDYTHAKHALLHTENPWSDAAQKYEVREAWFARHQEGSMQETLLGTLDAKIGKRRAMINSPQGMGILAQNGHRVVQELLETWGLIDEGRGWQDGEVVTDTNEIRFNYDDDQFEVRTERLEAYSGFGTEGLDGRLQLSHAPMTLIAAAMDGHALVESKHILITAMGECRNSHERWAGRVLLERGGAPIVYSDLQGEYELLSNATAMQVFGLTDDGERAEEIPSTKTEDGFKLKLGGFVHYQVVARS